MSNILNWITAISLLALAGVLFYRDYKAGSWKGFFLHATVLLACLEFLRRFYGFLTTAPVSKGESGDDIYFIIVLYVIMLLGMVANYAYQRFSTEKSERKQWDFGLFLAPVFVSPIIFIPLLTAFQQQNSDSPKMMLFLVAFQNGFLWKEYFDHKRRKVIEDGATIV